MHCDDDFSSNCSIDGNGWHCDSSGSSVCDSDPSVMVNDALLEHERGVQQINWLSWDFSVIVFAYLLLCALLALFWKRHKYLSKSWERAMSETHSPKSSDTTGSVSWEMPSNMFSNSSTLSALSKESDKGSKTRSLSATLNLSLRSNKRSESSFVPSESVADLDTPSMEPPQNSVEDRFPEIMIRTASGTDWQDQAVGETNGTNNVTTMTPMGAQQSFTLTVLVADEVEKDLDLVLNDLGYHE